MKQHILSGYLEIANFDIVWYRLISQNGFACVTKYVSALKLFKDWSKWYLSLLSFRHFFEVKIFCLQIFEVRFKFCVTLSLLAQRVHQVLLVAQVRLQRALQLSNLNLIKGNDTKICILQYIKSKCSIFFHWPVVILKLQHKLKTTSTS